MPVSYRRRSSSRITAGEWITYQIARLGEKLNEKGRQRKRESGRMRFYAILSALFEVPAARSSVGYSQEVIEGFLNGVSFEIGFDLFHIGKPQEIRRNRATLIRKKLTADIPIGWSTAYLIPVLLESSHRVRIAP